MKKYALVIGVSTYSDPEINDLGFAARDAQEVGLCLRECCGFDEVRTVASGGPTEPDHLAVVDALHNLAPLLSPEDLFLFYFAGHGIETDGAAHLLTCNSRIRMPQLASLSTKILCDCLSHIECADRVLILDACRNDPRKGMGDGDNLMTSAFSRDIMVVAETPVEGTVPATCVLFSCGQGQRAYEWPDKHHGAFTHYLLEGLQGAAADPKGQITVQNLGRYVESQVPRWAKKARTPCIQTPWGEQKGSWREIVLAVKSPYTQTTAPKQSPIVPPPRRNVSHWWIVVNGREEGPLDEPTVIDGIRSGKIGPTTEVWKEGTDSWSNAGQVEQLKAYFPKTESKPEIRHATVQRVALPEEMDIVCGEGITMKLKLIPAGQFMMGSTKGQGHMDEYPQHKVKITKPFYMGIYPVTQAQYKAVMGRSPSKFTGSHCLPVERVSWDDCVIFCKRLSEKTNKTFQLPTEAQWEYACRAGTTTKYCFGDNEKQLTEFAWFTENSDYKTYPVGQKRPNAWGLYDMQGNVWEWCSDCYDQAYYGVSACNNPTGPQSGSVRVVRGGSWGVTPGYCRSARRGWDSPGLTNDRHGFRVVCVPDFLEK